MNRRKWIGGRQSHEVFANKLAEEFGEVGKARRQMLDHELMSRAMNHPDAIERARASIEQSKAYQKGHELITELDHVIFIAECWRLKLAKQVGDIGA